MTNKLNLDFNDFLEQAQEASSKPKIPKNNIHDFNNKLHIYNIYQYHLLQRESDTIKRRIIIYNDRITSRLNSIRNDEHFENG